jgi:hypothetical protein
MKIQALIIAAALSSATAFAASPNDTAKPADANAKPGTSKSMAKHHQKMAKHHQKMGKHHAMHHGMNNRNGDTTSSSPTIDPNDPGRQTRMDDALATYRKQHG